MSNFLKQWNEKYHRKPHILILADKAGWAYDISARALKSHLEDRFSIDIAYVHEKPNLKDYNFDLIHVCWWGETYHQPFVRGPWQVVKEISSHRWQEFGIYGPLSIKEFSKKYLSDADTLTVTSQRLYDIISRVRPCFYAPNGFNQIFQEKCRQSGDIRIGWAGNASDSCKGLKDILLPAADGLCELYVADGSLNLQEVNDFYSSIDVLCIASTAEGEPLTLLEAMSTGKYILATDVGIVPELIEDGKNGHILPRTIEDFKRAMSWCLKNPEQVRAAGCANSRLVRAKRSWSVCKGAWQRAWLSGLSKRLGEW